MRPVLKTRIDQLARARGLENANQFGVFCGFVPHTAHRLYHDRGAALTLTTLEKLSAALDVEIGELFQHAPAPRRKTTTNGRRS